MRRSLKIRRNEKSILLVANATWNVYNFRLNVVSKFISKGYKVYVVAPVDKFIRYKKLYPEVIHISLRWLKRDGVNPVRELFLTWELNKIYKSVDPSLIIHYTVKPNIYGSVAAYLQGIPSIGVVTGLGYAFLRGGWVKGITKLLYRITNNFHKELIFENLDDRLLFQKEGLIARNKGISIKGCGVNSKHFLPQVSKPSNETVTFTFIGRMIYDKGIEEFVTAAKILQRKYQKARFWMVGEIDDKNPSVVKKTDLNKWVAENIITYHGSTDDIRKFIGASDCIVLPSYREAIARALTEGMSMGKPVIATNTAGCREAVEHGKNGFLVPVRDAKSLAKAMEKFIHLTQTERLSMGRHGREKVLREFDDRLIANQLYRISQSIEHYGAIQDEGLKKMVV